MGGPFAESVDRETTEREARTLSRVTSTSSFGYVGVPLTGLRSPRHARARGRHGIDRACVCPTAKRWERDIIMRPEISELRSTSFVPITWLRLTFHAAGRAFALCASGDVYDCVCLLDILMEELQAKFSIYIELKSLSVFSNGIYTASETNHI